MTQNIALGAELLYVGKNNVSGVSLLGRYSGRDHTVSAQWSSMGALSMSWIRKYTDKVSVGASRMELDGQGLLSELLKVQGMGIDSVASCLDGWAVRHPRTECCGPVCRFRCGARSRSRE